MIGERHDLNDRVASLIKTKLCHKDEREQRQNEAKDTTRGFNRRKGAALRVLPAIDVRVQAFDLKNFKI